MQRQERFPKEFEEQVLQLVQALGAQIFKKCKEAKEQRDRADVRRANMALAHLLKKCLSLMNRGFAFRLVSLFLERFSPQDEIDLHALKFEFLEIICSHEHFVALNLPSLRGYYTRGHSKNSKGTNKNRIIVTLFLLGCSMFNRGIFKSAYDILCYKSIKRCRDILFLFFSARITQ